MVNKLIILGMDGLDYDFILDNLDELPTFNNLFKQNQLKKMKSIFPADTTPAWSTVYLGVDPSYHGIINFVNMKDKEESYQGLKFDDSVFNKKCFWDKLNESNLSCAVVLPMNIKKGWDINGLMITRPYEGKINIYPNEKYNLYKPNNKILGTDAKFTSEKNLWKLEKVFYEKSDEEIRLTKKVIEHENVDVLFSYFSTPDGIQHDFWSYCDKRHPDYTDNPYSNAILNLYKKMDSVIADIQQMCPSTKILIFSDHGHGARPTKTIRINEILKRKGYLVRSGTKEKGMNQATKQKLFNSIRKIGIPKWTVKLAKKIPIWKKMLAPSSGIDWEKTGAYLSDLSAVKNYSYGGIKIAEKFKNNQEYINKLIDELEKIIVDDKPLFDFVMPANQLYSGPFLTKYPDIIFQMNEEYGAGWDFGEDLIIPDKSHLISPGGHRYYSSVLASSGIDISNRSWKLEDMNSLIIENCK